MKIIDKLSAQLDEAYTELCDELDIPLNIRERRRYKHIYSTSEAHSKWTNTQDYLIQTMKMKV